MADEKKPMHVDKVAAIYAQQGADVTVELDGKAHYAGTNPHLRAKLGEAFGSSFFADIGTHVNAEGQLDSVNPAVNYVGEPHNVAGVDVLPVARVEAAIPTSKGADFGAGNVTTVAGAILSPNGSKVDLTLAGVTNMAATDPALYGRVSGTAYESDAATVTPFVSAVVGTKSGNNSVTEGVRLDHGFNNGTGVYAQVTATQNLPAQGKTELTANMTVGMTFGGTTKPPVLDLSQAAPQAMTPEANEIVARRVNEHMAKNAQQDQASSTQPATLPEPGM